MCMKSLCALASIPSSLVIASCTTYKQNPTGSPHADLSVFASNTFIRVVNLFTVVKLGGDVKLASEIESSCKTAFVNCSTE